MIGSSPRMIEIYKTISHVAPTDATVLIEGETGTGKELIARMIHRNSRRAQQPFVPVDCGAIAPSLLESELFGTLKGAYTGADRDRMGVFEAAAQRHRISGRNRRYRPGISAEALRFLQEREIRPLGSARARKVDVRVIAATNRDVQKMVDEGKFREDLWYRLNVVRLTVPPLCERPSDIPLLVHYFLKRYNERYKLDTRLTDSGLKAMEEYSWPGNIRQLQHMMERLTILAPGGRIDDRGGARRHRADGFARKRQRNAGRHRSRADPPRAGRDQRQQEPRRQDPGHRAQDSVPQAGQDGSVRAASRQAQIFLSQENE